jgi:hypothetical protein
MRKTLAGVLLVLAAPAAAGAGLPASGTLVPGRSLGGVRLGETAAAVRTTLGVRYGVCHSCATTTWYYTYRPFTRQGLGVELVRGRVAAVYTIWRPAGWSGPKHVRLGAVEAQVTSTLGPLIPIACSGYDALTADTATARTAYYVVDGKLWGFGLFEAHASPCR